jgi:hypothetical protein
MNVRISDIPTGGSLYSSENIQANSGTVLQVKTQSLPYTVFAIHYLPIIVILTVELHYWAIEHILYIKK